jgi:hypothetical protein
MREEQNEVFLRKKNEIERIANEAVMKAKEENRRLGIPEFFSKNGVIYYVLENGELTTKRPEILENKT